MYTMQHRLGDNYITVNGDVTLHYKDASAARMAYTRMCQARRLTLEQMLAVIGWHLESLRMPYGYTRGV